VGHSQSKTSKPPAGITTLNCKHQKVNGSQYQQRRKEDKKYFFPIVKHPINNKIINFTYGRGLGVMFTNNDIQNCAITC
ncbi:uncharacterized protein METZ01_LOCUS139997, partial [marine metagenome]